MNKFFALVCLALVSLGGLVQAQAYETPDRYIELLRSDIKTQRVAIITEVMQFSQEEAELFWPIYKEYEFEVSKLGDERVAMIKDYAASFDTMTDEKAKELAERTFKLDAASLKLQQTYFKKFDKVLGSKTVAKFFQLDRQIDLLIRLQIAAGLPLIE